MRRSKNLSLRCLVSSAFAAVAVYGGGSPLGLAAAAAERGAEQTGGLEEIIVTATRRETILSDTPISLSVLSAAELERNRVTTLDDVARIRANRARVLWRNRSLVQHASWAVAVDRHHVQRKVLKAWRAARVIRDSLSSGFAAAALLLGACVAPMVAAADTQSTGNRYSVVAKIPGPDGMWDYAAVSPVGHRLYLAQGEQISVLDLAGARAWTQMGVPGAAWHGVVPIPERGVIIGTNGQAHAMAVFDAHTQEVLSAISTAGGGPKSALAGRMAKFAVLADPDAAAVDPKTGWAAAVNGGSGEVVFVDLDKRVVAGRVLVGGKLEFAVADGRGRLYVNVQTAHEIAVIDVPALKVVQRLVLTGCVEPKGLAYDVATDLLISGCDNGVLKFISAKRGKTVASRPIGRGADAVIVDERRHRVFVPSGEDATLSIFDIADSEHIALIQTLATEKGTRLGAVDVSTGRVYLPSALLGPPIPPRPWPSAVPGTFHVLVVSDTGGA